MKIYLAGKIRKDCWRHTIVENLRGASDESLAEWPILYKAIGNTHDYVGPYFLSCDHGCLHNTKHAQGIFYPGKEEYCFTLKEPSENQVVDACFKSIQAADLVFAWIDEDHAYGTVAELAYARTLQKNIVIAFADEQSKLYQDMWFIRSLCKEQLRGKNKEWNANEALYSYLENREDKKGYVYFIEATGLERVKIGYSANPEKRLKELRTGTPTDLNIIAVIPGDMELEKKLHRDFDNCRYSGEWFHLTKDLRNFIETKK